MEFCVLDEVIRRWERELSEPEAQPLSPERRLALAWHLRQRDAVRSRQLMEALRAELSPSGSDADRLLHAWLDLLDAEMVLFQQLDLDRAQRLVQQQALPMFEQAGEAIGCSEAWMCLARIALVRGQVSQTLACLSEAGAAATRAGDAERTQVADLWARLSATFADPVAGRQRGAPDDAELAQMSPGVAVWAHELRGTLAAQASDYGRAAAERMSAMQLAQLSGQIGRAVVASFNAADALNSLNEHELALQWMERGLALVRQHGLPLSMGHGLAQMGDTLRRLGRLEPARQCLQEALQLLRPLPPGRSLSIALKYWADLKLDLGELAEVEPGLQELLALASAQGYPDMSIHACRALAQLYSRQGRVAEALQQAQLALDGARQTGHVLRQIESLRVLADLHHQHGLPGPAGEPPDEAALQLLAQSLSLAQSIEGYLVPGELLEALAELHRLRGDLELAYQLARQASAARLKIQSDAANKRLLALQVLHQTERALAEAEHLRQLAQEQLQRSEMLARTQAQLMQQEKLASLGRLVAGVAHELNTPIGNCLLAASTWQERTLQLATLAQSRGMKRSDLDRYLSEAEASADLLLRGLQRAAGLVQQFKQLAHDSAGAPARPVDLKALCALLLASLRPRAEAARVQLQLDEPVEPVVWLTQADALQQVLLQLLDNALTHGFAGRDPGQLLLRLRPLAEAGLAIEVADDGVGMAPDVQSRVFDPFFSTRFGQGGSGLGLHIAHHLATAVLGGSLSLHSMPGQGSCFCVQLPPTLPASQGT